MTRLTSRIGIPRPRYRAPRFGPTPALCYLFRKARAFTQHRAAAHFAIAPRTWQYYEAGERRPPRRIIAAMLTFLNSMES